MTASRVVASLSGVAVLVLVTACGQRSAVWTTAMAETECHASDVVVQKLKAEPGTYVVYACGQELRYRCDEADTCVVIGDPAPAEILPEDPSPEATPEDPAAEALPSDAPASEEPPSEEPPADEPTPAEDAPSDEATPTDDATQDTDEAGAVPEPP